jgi:hypothetical protein
VARQFSHSRSTVHFFFLKKLPLIALTHRVNVGYVVYENDTLLSIVPSYSLYPDGKSMHKVDHITVIPKSAITLRQVLTTHK